MSMNIGIEKEILQPFIDDGLTYAEIANELNCSVTKITYNCKKYGLISKNAKRLKNNKELFKIGKKQCSKCDEIKSTSQFHIDSRSSDKLTSECKICKDNLAREWKIQNKDIVLANSRRWKERNPDRVKAYTKKYWSEHKEEQKAKLREFYRKNPGLNRIYCRRRTARKNGAPGLHSLQQLEWRKEVYGYLCYICGDKADTIDHVIPISKGGSEWPANLRPACRSCNSRKNNGRLTLMSEQVV